MSFSTSSPSRSLSSNSQNLELKKSSNFEPAWGLDNKTSIIPYCDKLLCLSTIKILRWFPFFHTSSGSLSSMFVSPHTSTCKHMLLCVSVNQYRTGLKCVSFVKTQLHEKVLVTVSRSHLSLQARGLTFERSPARGSVRVDSCLAIKYPTSLELTYTQS